MVQIDLITGFLGSGKTTFIKKYVRYLTAQGLRVGILENDYGAVNVDVMLLNELTDENCEIEMVAGGCCKDCHQRRFKTKLIAMGMSGYDRVIVEPSGIYDVDEFFDALREEPLDSWYEIGNVIAIVDAKLEDNLSDEADYLLASEAACAGCLVISKSQEATHEEVQNTIAHVNRALKKIRCGRVFPESIPVSESGDTLADRHILCKNWDDFTPEDFASLRSCGYVNEDYVKMDPDEEEFQSVYFLNIRISEEKLLSAAKGILNDPACGDVFRIKGFIRTGETAWLQLNATRQEITAEPISVGQEVIIVIGEHLVNDAIEAHFS
ncbi:MAG: GTPase (G3E family) [Lachnospiraceae bacterium]|nr:GTPase (G3E family) [Lachnospiraceae bacterium]